MARGWRPVAASAALLMLAGLLAACGGAPKPGPAASSAPARPNTPTATPTDRSPHGVLLSAELAMHSARRAKFSYRLGRDGGEGMLFWAPKTVLELRHPDSTAQLIVLDTTAYRGGDQATADRRGGRHWERYAGAAGPDGQKAVPYTGLIDRITPTVPLNAAVAADPVLLGEEKLLDGTAEHYRATTAVEQYAAAQSQLPADRRQALRDALGVGGVSQLTIDLWLNDKDQPVQVRVAGSGPGGRLDDAVQYTDFGGPLSVQAPAESDTWDAGSAGLPPVP